MGWWITKDGLTLGDGPVDEAHEFLRRVLYEYQEEQGRKPTLRELMATIRDALSGHEDRLLDGGEKIVVTDIMSKTKRRPKRQPYKIGDVFAVPMDDGTFAFGRISPQYMFFEFFGFRTNDSLGPSKVLKSGVVRLPAIVSYEPLKTWRWKVVGHLPYKVGEFKIQPFLMDDRIWIGSKENSEGFVDVSADSRAAEPEELKSVPYNSMWTAKDIEDELKRRLPLNSKGKPK